MPRHAIRSDQEVRILRRQRHGGNQGELLTLHEIAHQRPANQRHPMAVQCGIDHEGRIGEGSSAAGPRRLHPSYIKPRLPRLPCVLQYREAGKHFLRSHPSFALSEKVRMNNRQPGIFEHLLAKKMFAWGLTVPNRDIGFALINLRNACGGIHLDGDRGMGAVEIREARNQPEAREGGQDAEAQSLMPARDGTGRRFELAQCGSDNCQVAMSIRRQCYRTGIPLEQRYTKEAFQFANSVTDGAARNIQVVGCPDKAHKMCNRVEGE